MTFQYGENSIQMPGSLGLSRLRNTSKRYAIYGRGRPVTYSAWPSVGVRALAISTATTSQISARRFTLC
jgi:hypothetical protein